MALLRVRTFSYVRAAIILLTISSLFLPTTALAKKFDFKNESVATYLKGTFGMSALGDKAYADSSGAQTTSFTDKVSTGYSGEFGILFAGSRFNLRLGAELVLPAHASETKGRNSSSQDLFNVASKVSALVPTAGIEYVAAQNAFSKWILGGTVGYATVKMKNEYAFTASSPYGLADFLENASGSGLASSVYGGYEFLFADNSTLTIDVGYRYLKVAKLTYQSDVTGFQGAKAKGDPVTNTDGSNRGLDLSGAFIGLGFRFYIGL